MLPLPAVNDFYMRIMLILTALYCSACKSTETKSEASRTNEKLAKVDYPYEADLLHKASEESRITVVQAKYGLPDLIKDSSGDRSRLYTPRQRPEYEWPAYAPRTFYYFKEDKYFTFVYGRLVETGTIPDYIKNGQKR